MSETLVYLRRGDRLLVVQATTWQGEERADIRWWARIGDQWQPTRAGVSLRPNELRGLMGALAVAWEWMFGGDVEGDGEALLERLLGGLTGEGGA